MLFKYAATKKKKKERKKKKLKPQKIWQLLFRKENVKDGRLYYSGFEKVDP